MYVETFRAIDESEMARADKLFQRQAFRDGGFPYEELEH